MDTEYFSIILYKASFAGICWCLVAYLCCMLHPKLGAILLRPARLLASALGVLFLLFAVGFVVGFPEPFLILLRSYM